MRLYIIVFFIMLLVSSCEETTELDLRQTPSKIVIEGLLTNKIGYQKCYGLPVYRFLYYRSNPRVESAVVRISDNTGQMISFVHNPGNHADSIGIYVPEYGFAGEVGKTYTLHVEVDGEIYEGSDQLLSVIPIDSLKFQVNDDEAEDPKHFGKFYEILMFAREPQDEENFYLFKFYRNDSLILYNPTDVYYSDDELLAEKIDGVPSPIYYAPNDKARMEIYSLTRKGYIFYNDLSTVMNGDGGGMFGSIPSSPRSNLTNGALGFFQVSAVQEKEVYIE